MNINTWIPYTLENRSEIRGARELAIKLSNGSTKIVTEKENMLHYIHRDCRTLVQAFQVIR